MQISRIIKAITFLFIFFTTFSAFSQCSFTLDNTVVTDPTCPGACDGSITLTVTPGASAVSYQWYDGGGTPIGSNSNSITGLCAGNYSVDIIESTGGTSQIFFDDFESGAAGWPLNVVTGPEGSDPNFFEVDDDEGGVAVGGCGIAGNGNFFEINLLAFGNIIGNIYF